MNGAKTESRRSAPRGKIRSIQIAYLNFQSGNSGIVLDVSAGGLGFQAVEPLETNQLLPFRLCVPGFRQIKLSGRVVWLDGTRKRGGLRAIVPVAERREFQLWQQQYLGSLSEADQSMRSPREPNIASQQQLEAKESRTSRNVLAGCLILALCITAAGGWRFLHLGRSISGANPQASAAAASQNAPPEVAARASHSRTVNNRRPNHYHAQLSARAVSPSMAGKLHRHADPIGAASSASAPQASLQPALRLTAKNSAPSPNRAMAEDHRNTDLLRRSSNVRPVQLELQTRPQASALSVSTHNPDAPSALATSRRIVAKPSENMNSNSPAAVPTAESEPLASTAQPLDAFKSQAPEPAPHLEPCQLVSSVQAAYPKQARKQRVEGDVKLRVVVGTDGTLRSVVPLDGPGLLIEAAVEATRQFHYKPALLNGQPIETIQTIDISFKLKR